MTALRTRMRQHLWKWQEDLPPESGWPAFFANCPRPASHEIPAEVEIENAAPVWPGRRGAQHHDAPDGSHICRAFESLEPENVRVVVLGQDPYPSRFQATGRAFEDGAWQRGRPQSIAKSLKPLLLASFSIQEGRADLFRAGSWTALNQADALALPDLGQYFDALARRGALFVNAAWTHTRRSHIRAHLTLWQPVLHHLLRKLARDAQEPLVFVLLGKKAQARFSDSGAEAEARRAGTWGDRVTKVELPHPNARGFFEENPWSRTNQLLADLGARPIDWRFQLPAAAPA